MLMLQLQLRQCLTFEDNDMYNATTGIKGLRKADKILRRYGTAGLLIGGMAKTIWENSNDLDEINSRKDVDVLVLGFDCKHHPKQWEGGIDWWISHSLDELPTNGKICLSFNVQIQGKKKSLFPGLYICPHDILGKIVDHETNELSLDSSSFGVKEGDVFYKIPTVDSDYFGLFLSKGEGMSNHCKPV